MLTPDQKDQYKYVSHINERIAYEEWAKKAGHPVTMEGDGSYNGGMFAQHDFGVWVAATAPLQERIAALEAKLAQRVPDGWKWVPVEPTPDQLRCGWAFLPSNFQAPWDQGLTKAREVYAAMLSAAPAAPEQQAPNAQQAELPPWWPAVENILNEYGLQAVDFVADFKAAQQAEAQEPVATIIISDDDFDLGLTDDYAFGLKRLPNGKHSLFTRPQPAQLQALSEEEAIAAWRGVKDVGDDKYNAILLGEAIQSALAAKNGVNLK